MDKRQHQRVWASLQIFILRLHSTLGTAMAQLYRLVGMDTGQICAQLRDFVQDGR
jgi:hypothetical protein